MKKEIVLVWTRDFTLAWAEWWSRDLHPRLVDVFGIGVPNQLSYFNGRLLETYRLAEEAEGFIQGVVNLDPKRGVLGKNKLDRYVVLIREMRSLLKKANKQKAFKDKSVFEQLKNLSAEMYPWYTVSYLLPQEKWAPKLIEKYGKDSEKILKRLIGARKESEGAVEEMIEYWRSATKALLKARKLPLKYDSFILLTEIEKMFEDNKYFPNFEELEARSKGFIFLPHKVYTGIEKDIFFKKRGFFHNASADDELRKEIKGAVACAGPASIRSKVSVILRNNDVKKFKPGNILVTVMTNPFFIPIMKKAAAIVTDEGGITCHAAIVSRELGIPCVIGTKNATKVLKDGDLVEVDSINGIVRNI